MAGGIFPGRPFSFNIKCIVFTAILAAGYWFAPHKNLWVLAFLLWFPYLALAWYDYVYGCRDKLDPTIVPFGRLMWLPFKPQDYKDSFGKMADAQIQTMNRLDHLVGWTIVAAAVTWYIMSRAS